VAAHGIRPGLRSAGLAAPWRAWLGLLVILTAYFAVRWPFRHAPLIRDEGEYAHLGQQILQGAVPYLEIYNQKTPLVFYLVAGVQRIGGESLEALRLATTAYGMVTAVIVFLIGRRLFGASAGLWAALAFCVMSFDQCGVLHSASTEFFMLLWLAVAVHLWFLGRERGRLWPAALAGAAAGLAYQTKQVGVAVLLYLWADALWPALWANPERPRVARRALHEAAWAALGFSMVLAATLAYFAAEGALGAYVEATWTNNWEYVGQRHRSMARIVGVLRALPSQVARWDLGLWLVGSVGLGALACTRPSRSSSGLWLLLAATFATGLLAGATYVQYFVPMIVPLSLGTGVACAWLVHRCATSPLPWRAVFLAALIAPWIAPAHHVRALLRDPAAALEAQVARLPPTGVSREVARYLAERTEPDEPILVVGSEPQIYFYARRPAASEMAHTYPLTGPYLFSAAKRTAFYERLRQHGPRYVVVVRLPSSLSEWRPAAIRFLDDVMRILQHDYIVEERFPRDAHPRLGRYVLVLRRKPLDL
jgi:4-amino-4-deoxy-L-arabinose transferase-like glycosyltransferase